MQSTLQGPGPPVCTRIIFEMLICNQLRYVVCNYEDGSVADHDDLRVVPFRLETEDNFGRRRYCH